MTAKHTLYDELVEWDAFVSPVSLELAENVRLRQFFAKYYCDPEKNQVSSSEIKQTKEKKVVILIRLLSGEIVEEEAIYHDFMACVNIALVYKYRPTPAA